MKDPAFLFYVRDWLCSSTVARMTGEQVKAYIYMLCSAWLEDDTASLPNNEEALAAAARVDLETWRRISPLIMTKWHDAGNGRVMNDRQWAEWQRRKARVNAALKREQAKHRTGTERAQNEHRTGTERAQNEHRTGTDHSTRLANANANANATPRARKTREKGGGVK